MAALHLLAAQSTQLPRASVTVATVAAPSPPSPPTYPGRSAPVYPYERETPHRLLSGALRRGKWTVDEEVYTASIIKYFHAGVLPLQYGTTLRGYIAQLLHCDPMRVSKKLIPGILFVGVRVDPKVGRRSYYPCPADTPGLDDRKEYAEAHLARLRAAFIHSIESEEQQELGETHVPIQRPSMTSGHTPSTGSPLKRKRSRDDDDSIETPPPSRPTAMANRTHDARVPSLPSLTQLLQQTRQHATPLQTPTHVYPTPSSMNSYSHQYDYSAPSTWPRTQDESARQDITSFSSSSIHALPPLRSVGYPASAPSPPY